MELDHQWIQWAFPIDTISIFNPLAPTIDESAEVYFFDGSACDINQKYLLIKYLNSIGIDIAEMTMDNDIFYSQVSEIPAQHSARRVSRVIKHLHLTGKHDYANGIKKLISEHDRLHLLDLEAINFWFAT